MSTEGLSKKEAAYLAKVQATAKRFAGSAEGRELSEERIAEIRRWEGPEAARAAQESVSQKAAYTSISRTPSPASASPQAVYSGNVAPTNTMAILALVFGVGGGLLGVVFGHIALSQINRTGESGRGLALAGLVCGYVGIGVLAIVLIVAAVAAGSHT